MPLLYLVVAAGLVAAGYYLAKQKGDKAPAVSDAEVQRKREEAVARADQIDEKQIREEIRDEAKDRAVKEAKDRAEVERKEREGSIGKPAYEILVKPDGTMGYWKEGKWHLVKPGERILGPYGAYGRFDAQGRFTPDAGGPPAAGTASPAEALRQAEAGSGEPQVRGRFDASGNWIPN